VEVRVALDTNRLTDLFRGDAELSEYLEVCDEVFIPLIVLAEIKAGFLGGNRNQHNEIVLRNLLTKPAFKVLMPSRETADHFAKLFVQLKRAGTPLADNDMWIGALALEHDLTLITRDRHFDRIPQLLRG
jgi:predicted nucleic acid-binding protein